MLNSIRIFSNETISFYKSTILDSLSNQQKKILLIASAVFGFLAFCYLAIQCYKRFQRPVEVAMQTDAIKKIDKQADSIKKLVDKKPDPVQGGKKPDPAQVDKKLDPVQGDKKPDPAKVDKKPDPVQGDKKPDPIRVAISTAQIDELKTAAELKKLINDLSGNLYTYNHQPVEATKLILPKLKENVEALKEVARFLLLRQGQEMESQALNKSSFYDLRKAIENAADKGTKRPDPVQVDKKPDPAKVDKKSDPVQVDKKPDPVQIDKQPDPAKVDKKPDPIQVDKKPDPVQVDKKPDPAKVDKKPDPVQVDKKPDPVQVDKQPDPAQVDKKPDPVEVDEKPNPFRIAILEQLINDVSVKLYTYNQQPVEAAKFIPPQLKENLKALREVAIFIVLKQGMETQTLDKSSFDDLRKAIENAAERGAKQATAPNTATPQPSSKIDQPQPNPTDQAIDSDDDSSSEEEPEWKKGTKKILAAISNPTSNFQDIVNLFPVMAMSFELLPNSAGVFRTRYINHFQMVNPALTDEGANKMVALLYGPSIPGVWSEIIFKIDDPLAVKLRELITVINKPAFSDWTLAMRSTLSKIFNEGNDATIKSQIEQLHARVIPPALRVIAVSLLNRE